MELYDYIYVDVEKVISVYSQITGGVVELRETISEKTNNIDKKWKYDFKVLKHDAGGTSENKEELKETIKPHHSLFSELEEELINQGHMLDLSAAKYKDRMTDNIFRESLKQRFCVKVTGRCVIEDYERIKSIADAFPKIIGFINKSNELSIKKSEPITELNLQIRQRESEIAKIKDRNQKAKAKAALKAIKRKVDTMLSKTDKVDGVEKWILDGMKTWIDAFLPGIVNLRVYPSDECMDTHVFGQLKKECFVDTDSNSIHFTYGSMPTENITLVGIITSVPMESDDDFDPLQEFDSKELSDVETVEKGFRGIFRGFDGMERMIRTCRFPRILVYPLLVYRKAVADQPLQTTASCS